MFPTPYCLLVLHMFARGFQDELSHHPCRLINLYFPGSSFFLEDKMRFALFQSSGISVSNHDLSKVVENENPAASILLGHLTRSSGLGYIHSYTSFLCDPCPLMVSLPCSRFSFWFLRLLKTSVIRKNQGKCGACFSAFSVSSLTRSPALFSTKPTFFLIFLPIEALSDDLNVFSENQLPCKFPILIPGCSDSVTIFLLGTHICKLMTTIICTLQFYLFS